MAALAARGLPKGKSPLTETDVREIFRRFNSGENQNTIAKNFSVHKSTISHIVEGKNWSHLGLLTTRPRIKKVVTEDQATETLRLNSLGSWPKEISKLVGISTSSIKKVLRGSLFPSLQGKFGERKYIERGVSVEVIRKIKELRGQGLSYSRIGKEVGVNLVTAWKYCR